nr:ATP-binding protein [Thermococcus sp. JdF3]
MTDNRFKRCPIPEVGDTVLELGCLVGGRNDPKEHLNGMSEVEYLKKHIRKKQWMVVIGPRLVGKSTLVHSVVDYLKFQYGYSGGYISVASSGSEGIDAMRRGIHDTLPIFRKILIRLKELQGISGTVSQVGVGASFGTLESVTRGIIKTLQEFPEKSVIVLDEVQALGNSLQQFLNALSDAINEAGSKRKLPTIILTGSMINLTEGIRGHNVSTHFKEMEVRPWPKETVRAYLESTHIPDVSNFEVDEVYEYSMGLPGLVLAYINGRKNGTHKDGMDRIRKYAKSRVREEIHSIISLALESYEMRIQERDMERALSTYAEIWRANPELSFEEIMRRVGLDENTRKALELVLEEMHLWGYMEHDPSSGSYDFVCLAYAEALASLGAHKRTPRTWRTG